MENTLQTFDNFGFLLIIFSLSSLFVGDEIHLAFADGCDSMQQRVSTKASLSEPWELLVP